MSRKPNIIGVSDGFAKVLDSTPVIGQEAVFGADTSDNESPQMIQQPSMIEGVFDGYHADVTRGGTPIWVLHMRQDHGPVLEVGIYGAMALAAECGENWIRRGRIQAEVTTAPNGKLIANRVCVDGIALSRASVEEWRENRIKKARGE